MFAQGNRAALPSASIMLKQPLSAFRGQVKFYASLVLEHKQTVWFFIGLRTRNSATRNEKHEETNGKNLY